MGEGNVALYHQLIPGMLHSTMASRNNHPSASRSDLQHDVRRLILTAVIVIVVMAIFTWYQERTHVIEKFIVLPSPEALSIPDDGAAGAPIPTTVEAQLE